MLDKKETEIRWLSEPQAHDYPAAREYLSLLFIDKDAKILAKLLKESDMASFAAKDIFRASGLPELGRDNIHVQKNIDKLENGHPLSPILLVKEIYHKRLIIADGYHRLCAVHTYNEDLRIPCKIVGVGLHP